MAHALTVFDEILGQRRPALTLDLPEPTIKARELIRSRIFEEVKGYNESLDERYLGLVQPPPEEQLLNRGPRSRRQRKIDWHEQARVALEAFERNGFMLLVDDRQVESLHEEIRVRPETQVVFLKLVPLQGG